MAAVPEGDGSPEEGWSPDAASARDALLARIAAASASASASAGSGSGAAAGPPVVLIDGPSGAGKSSLADLLAARWPGGAAVRVVRMDDLYPGWDGLDAASDALAETLLGPLARTGSGRWRRWDWAADRPAGWHEVAGPGPVVVEGCGTLARRSIPYAALTLWLDADDALRKARALDRDGETFATHWAGWQSAFDRYLAREDPRAGADLRLDVTGWPIGTPRWSAPPSGPAIASSLLPPLPRRVAGRSEEAMAGQAQPSSWRRSSSMP